MRGLCSHLPSVRPYSRAKVLSVIEEILENNVNRRFGALTEAERRILEQFQEDFSPARDGINWTRGTFSIDHTWNNIYFSGELGFGLDYNFTGSYYPFAGGFRYDDFPEDETLNGGFEGAVHPASGDTASDYSIMPSISFTGDLGRNLSYGLILGIWIGRSPRTVLGTYFNAQDPGPHPGPGELERRRMVTFSEPLAHFPYTYKKRWDGYVWPVDELTTGGMLAWPKGNVSVGYFMLPELSGTLLNGHIHVRFARLDREWAGMTNNGSLVLNQSAQPFLALETIIQPFPWISFSSLTGILEYHNATGAEGNRGDGGAGIQTAAETFQNAYSIVMLELKTKNYFHVSIGSSVVWPKRLELGYLFPFADNFIYQTNIGDFDNMALFLNVQARYPGLGKLWLSIFIDEMSFSRDFLRMSKMMFAYQFGGSFHIPWLPFSSIKVSYTKNEPYNYTHIREDVPWYQSPVMETNYVSFGKSLGHYIPPNSDELLLRLEVLPNPRSAVSLQYQLIRHGANYGDRAVAGSSLWSELLVHRNYIRKYFLRDGAYKWTHILRLGGEYSFTSGNVPVKLYAEAGGVFSYFTDIDNSIRPNSGRPSSYRVIDTSKYPHSLNLIGSIGIRIFPKF
jgi:hypothetical protein